MIDIKKYKENQKTNYLAETLERLLFDEAETLKMLESDPKLVDLAKGELETITLQKEALIKQMDEILEVEKKEEEFPNEVILEVRAGAGGEEAAFFAEKLASMYQKYADRKGWSFLPVDESRSELGGYKEASFEIRGKNVYKELRFETGVHRIQRIVIDPGHGGRRIQAHQADGRPRPVRPREDPREAARTPRGG